MKALVTGGGGFLGRAIVAQLRERGDHVRSFSRQAHPELTELGVEQIQGDLSDVAAVERAADGCDVVFHVAAKAGIWGPYKEYYYTNVVGTRNVIAACRKKGMHRLVHTSTPSVVFRGRDEKGIDERAPYSNWFLAWYPHTKCAAEWDVLDANGPELATVALRPHLIWGPGDNHLIPRLLDRARQGKLIRIGSGKNLADTTYVDNAASAHLLAADRLSPGGAIAGKAYFISQGEPVNLWDFINRILALGSLPPVARSIPAWLAFHAGSMMELRHWLLRRPGEPNMTRFLARQLSTSHWFDISAARRDLGYAPLVSTEEGLKRLGEWLKSERR
ncbi:MAG TPA: NAD-dependent epimerase/dehydratase family protein [Gemmataceae bacterium]|jgi:nucleoside-diphosphate-sugar epimerase|nr:NAD-dependent epimerase/dehydratase family protein [Gemmataceae bacterium]